MDNRFKSKPQFDNSNPLQFLNHNRNKLGASPLPKDDFKFYTGFPSKPVTFTNIYNQKQGLSNTSSQNFYKVPTSPLKDYNNTRVQQITNISKTPTKQRPHQVYSNQKSNNYYSQTADSKTSSNFSYQLNNQLPKKLEMSYKDNNLSWTKFIAMELRNQELEKNILLEQTKINEKTLKIEQLQNRLQKIGDEYQSKFNQMRQNYQKKLQNQKSDYESRLIKNNQKINQLIQKINDETKNCLSQQIKQYITQILNSNMELKNAHQQHIKQKQISPKKVIQLQEENRISKENIQKLQKSVSQLSIQLCQANQRLMSRIGASYGQSTSFLQIIQSQSTQIDELRKSLEVINDEYLKIKASQSQANNKLTAYQVQQNVVSRKDRLHQNNIVGELGLSLTKKQNENSILRRKITSTQSRLNNALEELRRKNQENDSQAALPHPEHTGIKNYGQSRRKILSMCHENHHQEIAKLKQRIALLQN